MNPDITQQEENLEKIDEIKILSFDLTKKIEAIQQEYVQMQFAQERNEEELRRELETTKQNLNLMNQRYNYLLKDFRELEKLLESIHKQSRKRISSNTTDNCESWD